MDRTKKIDLNEFKLIGVAIYDILTMFIQLAALRDGTVPYIDEIYDISYHYSRNIAIPISLFPLHYLHLYFSIYSILFLCSM